MLKPFQAVRLGQGSFTYSRCLGPVYSSPPMIGRHARELQVRAAWAFALHTIVSVSCLARYT